MYFEIANITVPFWLPPVVGFVISFFTSMVGVSGAFLLLPFQMSVLGYVSPSVSGTNLVYNLAAIPGGVIRYVSEKRMDWLLAMIIASGTLPGLAVGWWLRIHWLLDPRAFKLFVGLVLLGLAIRLLLNKSVPAPNVTDSTILTHRLTAIFATSLVIGIIGGAYGIGGGSIMAPVLIALFRLPVHGIAGAALFGTFASSVVGVALYQFIPGPAGIETRPDFALGLLFGIGGFVGMYAGARMQQYIRQLALELGIAMVLALLAGGYIAGSMVAIYQTQ